MTSKATFLKVSAGFVLGALSVFGYKQLRNADPIPSASALTREGIFVFDDTLSPETEAMVARCLARVNDGEQDFSDLVGDERSLCSIMRNKAQRPPISKEERQVRLCLDTIWEGKATFGGEEDPRMVETCRQVVDTLRTTLQVDTNS